MTADYERASNSADNTAWFAYSPRTTRKLRAYTWYWHHGGERLYGAGAELLYGLGHRPGPNGFFMTGPTGWLMRWILS